MVSYTGAVRPEIQNESLPGTHPHARVKGLRKKKVRCAVGLIKEAIAGMPQWKAQRQVVKKDPATKFFERGWKGRPARRRRRKRPLIKSGQGGAEDGRQVLAQGQDAGAESAAKSRTDG